MKILRYYPRAWRGDGGITNSVRKMSAAVERTGATVRIAVDEQSVAPTSDGLTWVPVRHSGPPQFRLPLDFDDYLEGVDVLVLHSAWVSHNVYAATVARRMGIPYILEPRGAYDPKILERRPRLKSAWKVAFENRLIEQAAAVHVFFESEVEHLRALGFRGSVIQAPNGVHIPDSARWDGGSGGYVLWFGRFDPEHKGLDLLLHAMTLINPLDRPTLRLHGPDWAGGKARVIRLVDRLGLENHVMIGEPVYGEDKWRLLSQATAFVYPSRWEGFGNSTAEAVCAGVPTLVTPYPLGRWLNTHGAAVLAEATPEALAEGLIAVTASDAASIGSTGSRLVSSQLSWDVVAHRWLDQCADVLRLIESPKERTRPAAPRRRMRLSESAPMPPPA